LFDSFTLYPILDPAVSSSNDFEQDLQQIVKSGVSLIQLRVKNVPDEKFLLYAERAREVTKAAGVKLIINDRPDIAVKVGADGVHVGLKDMSVAEARKILGPGKLIGGTVETVEDALRAEKEGADYVGVGAIFPSLTKQDAGVLGLNVLKKIREKLKIPVVAIGGINMYNFKRVLAAGVKAVAVISDIFHSNDIPSKVREYFRRAQEHVREK
jgi:thiamine-phosphate pyrophosphorylase